MRRIRIAPGPRLRIQIWPAAQEPEVVQATRGSGGPRRRINRDGDSGTRCRVKVESVKGGGSDEKLQV
jgi:hypothetical protein